MYTNTRSVLNKVKELEEIVLEKDFDIIGITETWMNSAIPIGLVAIKGYRMIQKFREEERGGGVMLYIKESLKVLECEQLSSSCDEL